MTNKPGAATIVKCSIGVAAESEDKISRTCSDPDRVIRGLFRGRLQQGLQALGGMLASRVQASRSSGQLKPLGNQTMIDMKRFVCHVRCALVVNN